MGFEDDRWDPADLAEHGRVVSDYVRRERIARGEILVEEAPQCAECGNRHSGHWNCQK